MSNLREAYEEYDELVGGESTSFAYQDDTLIVTKGADHLTIGLDRKLIKYGPITRAARSMRLDAPYLAVSARTYGAVHVDAPVVMPGVELLPTQYWSTRVTLGPADLDRDPDDLPPLQDEITRISCRAPMGMEPPDQLLSYEVDGLCGLEDAIMAAADALLLASTVESDECPCVHRGTFTGDLALNRANGAATALMAQHKICETCLSALERMGFPLAPELPKEW